MFAVCMQFVLYSIGSLFAGLARLATMKTCSCGYIAGSKTFSYIQGRWLAPSSDGNMYALLYAYAYVYALTYLLIHTHTHI